MKKLIFALLPLLFSFLCISAQKSSSDQELSNEDYYFQPGNQLRTEIYSYEVRELVASNKFINITYFGSDREPPVAYLAGKLNTGKNLNLSKLLDPGNTDAINLESDTTYQITFSGNLRFQAIDFSAGYKDGLDFGTPIYINVELYGTDTFTLRPNETKIIQVDFARPPQLISHIRNKANIRWQLQVTNK